MKSTIIKRLSKNLRLGGTRLSHTSTTGTPPLPDGVRYRNDKFIELETFANINKTASAFSIGLFIVIAIPLFILLNSVAGPQSDYISDLIASLFPTLFAIMFYLLGGAHRSRGAFIRIHRGTRKLYYVFPGKKHLHILDWDQLEVLAGYVPIVTGTINTSRHPLYLIGVDYNLSPPREICIACGNLGLYDGDKSAKSLWAYLQHFMAHGPEDLPEPSPLPPV